MNMPTRFCVMFWNLDINSSVIGIHIAPAQKQTLNGPNPGMYPWPPQHSRLD